MVDEIIKIYLAMKDPALFICFVVIYFMYRMLNRKDVDLMNVHNTCSMNDREQTRTLSELVTLVNVIVTGGRK